MQAAGRVLRCLLAALLFVVQAACGGVEPAAPAVAAPAGEGAPPTVVLLSLDGVRADYLDRFALPALERMARDGARAEALAPVFPSSTFPNHVSLATGTFPDRHGIVGNRFLDPERGVFDYDGDAAWLEAEPLWVAAERQGVRAAVFFWVGSDTDWRGVGATHRVVPFDGDLPEREKVERILGWLDLSGSQRPGLVMTWWNGADTAGHRFGPGAPETRAALEAQDAELARLLTGLDARDAWGDTTLVVVSDHGMFAVDEAVDPRAALETAGIDARVFPGSGYAHIYLSAPAEAARAAEILATLPGVQAWPRAAVPRALRAAHPTRSGDVLAVVDPPRVFGRGGLRGALERRLRRTGGAHGHVPAGRPELDAVFLALGRGVPAGHRPGRVRAVDVAPTLARLLGIEPPAASEGTPISGIGAP